MQLLHTEVLDPLHTLLAIALELPEDYFCSIHKYEAKSEDHIRYMKYTKFTPEELSALGNWVRGHTGTRSRPTPMLSLIMLSSHISVVSRCSSANPSRGCRSGIRSTTSGSGSSPRMPHCPSMPATPSHLDWWLRQEYRPPVHSSTCPECKYLILNEYPSTASSRLRRISNM